MKSLSETLKRILHVENIELTLRGKTHTPEEKLRVLNQVMDLMQNYRAELISQLDF